MKISPGFLAVIAPMATIRRGWLSQASLTIIGIVALTLAGAAAAFDFGLFSAKIGVARCRRVSHRLITRSTTLCQASIRDAGHQGLISRGRAARPPLVDGGTLASGRSPISAEDPAHRVPAHCEDVRRCNGSPNIRESHVDAPGTLGSANLGIRAVLSQSHARRWHSPWDSQRVIAIPRLPERGSNRRGAWRRSDLDHGSGSDALLHSQRLPVTAAASRPRSGSPSH
jgi:hypothetical protein